MLRSLHPIEVVGIHKEEGVRVRVVTRASVGVMVRFYFAVVLVFSQFYAFTLRRCGMGTALGLGSGG